MKALAAYFSRADLVALSCSDTTPESVRPEATVVARSSVALLRHFDIFKEAGANRGVVKTFRGLEPNGQGKLQLWFMPSRDYANVFAIEVTPE